ncbi:hypothetical protein F8388_011886 [Cannabis sativa]|uniref:Uncharacterized protein n=1 Tax=Cannabis sativa TaxID=3483 RepID=A0A7J6GDE9_CANSA|nr:hypothetical protein G4B88_011518 [Cannabis sativa]KAF4348301.1 hypothetical protein G4B88_011519 [Cannabis sativa]KAF4380963.1 hypothetical protein F8388_011885 [Cannabis sativa]KAF4380964.1 hypothetical protein F8388_011886 [Cannabis sativa]
MSFSLGSIFTEPSSLSSPSSLSFVARSDAMDDCFVAISILVNAFSRSQFSTIISSLIDIVDDELRGNMLGCFAILFDTIWNIKNKILHEKEASWSVDQARREILKQQSEDNYVLTAVETNGHTYLKFLPSGNGENTQSFDIIDAGQNRVRIQCVGTDKYWKLDRTAEWIQAEAAPILTTDSLFISAVDGLSYTSYQNVANGMYCKTFTQRPVEDCIKASAPTLTQAVKLILNDI